MREALKSRPSRRAQDLCRYLCWRGREPFREAMVRMPQGAGDQVAVVDVSTPVVEPRGVLTIDDGSEPRTLRIRRVRVYDVVKWCSVAKP